MITNSDSLKYYCILNDTNSDSLNKYIDLTYQILRSRHIF